MDTVGLWVGQALPTFTVSSKLFRAGHTHTRVFLTTDPQWLGIGIPSVVLESRKMLLLLKQGKGTHFPT